MRLVSFMSACVYDVAIYNVFSLICVKVMLLQINLRIKKYCGHNKSEQKIANYFEKFQN